ncbi:MAG: PAS domain S-box protein, partial [Moraxellaceae bacterium]
LELVRKAGFSEQELRALMDAKINSDRLTLIELEAMKRAEVEDPKQPVSDHAAFSMLFGDQYDRAKTAIMLPINNSYRLVEMRTSNAVAQAEHRATLTRLVFIGFGLSLVFMLWRINQTLRTILGGSVNEVYAQITRIGKGDFSVPILVDDDQKNSILGWLAETQHNLHLLQQHRFVAEEAKEASDERYRTLFDSAPLGINIFSAEGEQFLIDGNTTLLKMLGYSVEELRQLHAEDVVAPLERSHISSAIDSIDAGENYFREWELRRKDGSTFPAEVIATKLGDGTMMSMIIDITQRKLAEEQLRHSEENLSITLQSIGDAVIATDAAGCITRMNPTAERMTGWMLADAKGQPLANVFRVINAYTREELHNPVQLVMERGHIVGLANNTTLIARDGIEYQISDSAAPIRNASGTIVGVVLVFSDVTERYQAEAALRRADERLRRTFKLIPVALTLQNPAGVMLDCSDAFCEVTGIEREKIIGHTTLDFKLWVDEQERETMRQLLLDEGKIDGHEFQLRRRNGEIRIMHMSARYLTKQPEPLLMAVLHDVTERKQAEQTVRQNERFIATLAHNIPGMVSHWTKDLRCNFANKEYLNWWGKTAEEVYQAKPQEILGEALYQQNAPLMRAALEGNVQSFERIVPRADGSSMYAWTQYIPEIEDGEVQGLFVVAIDISKRKQAELALQESVLHTQAILDNMFDGVITINTQGIIESFNKAASTILGYSQDDVVGTNVNLLMPDHYKNQHEYYLKYHTDSLDAEPILNTLREVEGKRKNGEIFPMSVSISKILRGGKATFVGLVRDISQQRQDEEEIYRLAFYDPLTNLPNRRLLFDRLQQAMLTSSRTVSYRSCASSDTRTLLSSRPSSTITASVYVSLSSAFWQLV